MKKRLPYIIILVLIVWHSIGYAQQRFPKPEFESGYTYPEYQASAPRSQFMEYFDVFVLIGVLVLTTHLTLKRRTRGGVIWVALFSLAYFGFFREGCICAIGSVQNVSLALFNPGYAIPLTALLFFLVPLVFALFYGRQFCAGACPLGAIQELTAIFPVRIPKQVESMLSAVPYLYLALSILFAATDSNFIICKYDPYVGIFRMNAPFNMVIFGVLLLISGLFVNRPYCRFLCPYGVILGWFSRFSGRHLTITPDECINCRLCENSCPYNAILPSTEGAPADSTIISRKRFTIYSLLIPLFITLGVFAGKEFSADLAMVHHDVRLAAEMRNENITGIRATSQQAVTFKESGTLLTDLYAREETVFERYRKGAPLAGAFLGLSLGIALVSLTVRRERKDYVPHKGKCYSCARCFDFCPVHIDKKEDSGKWMKKLLK